MRDQVDTNLVEEIKGILNKNKAAENKLRDILAKYPQILLSNSNGYRYVKVEVPSSKGRSDLVIYVKKLNSKGEFEYSKIIWECKCFKSVICEYLKKRLIPSKYWISAESQLMEYVSSTKDSIMGGIIIGCSSKKANFSHF